MIMNATDTTKTAATTKATSIISYAIRFVDDADAKMANGQSIDVPYRNVSNSDKDIEHDMAN